MFFVFIGIFLVSLFSQLFVSNKLAVQGKTMVELDLQKQALQKDISELKLAQSHYASLSYIEGQAKQLGFVENDNFVNTITFVTATAVLPSF